METNQRQMTLESYAPEIFRQRSVGYFQLLALISPYLEGEPDLTENEADWLERLSVCLTKKNPTIDPNLSSVRMCEACYRAMVDGIISPFKLNWNSAGTLCNGNFSTASILFHRTGNESTLSDVLEEEVDEKYFLSEYTAKKLLSLKDTTVEDLITHTQKR